MVNFEKSFILFSPNVKGDARQAILQQAQSPTITYYGKYLGLPTIIGRLKYESMQSLKDRVWKRIERWKEILVPRRGKEVLIKVVA